MPYVYIAYSRRYPYLPIACEDSARNLAAAVGVSRACVASLISRHESGKVKNPIYMRIFVEDENDE